METKTINSTITGITENYKNTLSSIITTINAKNYVVKIDGDEELTSVLFGIDIELSELTQSGRKKIAKRLFYYENKRSLKTINFLFHVLRKMSVIKVKVSVDVSNKETEIQSARKLYVKLRKETEDARLTYKQIKGDFYK